MSFSSRRCCFHVLSMAAAHSWNCNSIQKKGFIGTGGYRSLQNGEWFWVLPNTNLWWLWLGRSCVTGPIQQIQRIEGGARNSMMVFRCFTTTMMPIQQLPSLLLLLAIRTNRCRAALRASTDMHLHRAASHNAKLVCIEGAIRIRVPASWSVKGHGVGGRRDVPAYFTRGSVGTLAACSGCKCIHIMWSS